MASHILSRGSRFHYSHEFCNIPTNQLIQWLTGEGELQFKMRRVKNDDGSYGSVHDIFINDYIYRPVELEKFGCYELMSKYTKKKIQKKKNGDHNVESKKTFNFTSEHPSHKYMVLSEVKHTLIPCIGNTSSFPNVSHLELNSLETFESDSDVYKAREIYAQLVLLLFFHTK